MYSRLGYSNSFFECVDTRASFFILAGNALTHVRHCLKRMGMRLDTRFGTRIVRYFF